MDPVSPTSLAESIVGIVDMITRSINSLHELHERWKEADLTVALLIAQLTILKVALNQIGKWIASNLADVSQFHRVVMDLESSLSSCRVLMRSVDHRISRLDWNEANALNYESRVRMILEDQSTKDYVNHLNNQTNALNLLLTAFSWSACQEPLLHLIK